MTSTAWPDRSATRMVLRSVLTTPLTWGAQASGAGRMRNRRPLVGRDPHRRGRMLGNFLPVQDGELSLLRLDQRGQTLHPVAVVAIENVTNLADLGLVNVTTHHAVD